METPSSTITTASYASFGARFVAYLLDVVICGILYGAVLTPLLTVAGLNIASQAQELNGLSEDEATGPIIGLIGMVLGTVVTAIIAIYVVQALYFSIMESSKHQATLGKMAVGIKVTDLDGNRISFGTALLRSLGKILSQSIMWIGFIMAAFTDRKQGLHDLLANTLVLKK